MEHHDGEHVTAPGANGHDDGVLPLPEAVLTSLGRQIAEAGGEYQEPPEYAGSIGRTMFDTPASDGATNRTLSVSH